VILLAQRIFRYGRSTMLTTDWAMVIIVLIIALGAWIIYHGKMIGGAAVILIGCGLLVPLYVNAKLMFSTLTVDDNGVTAIAFGRSWKSIKWGNVKDVRSAQWASPGYKRPIKTFLICTTDKNRFYIKADGPVVFNDTIVDFPFLLDFLRDKGRQYGFTVAS
jgi:hypothetical protein